ncbi:MAG: hypothetical protein C4318_02860 [Acidimicrobiia bacterium]
MSLEPEKRGELVDREGYLSLIRRNPIGLARIDKRSWGVSRYSRQSLSTPERGGFRIGFSRLAVGRLALILLGAGIVALAGFFLLGKPAPVAGSRSSRADLGLAPRFVEEAGDSSDGVSPASSTGASSRRLPVAVYVTGAVNSPGVYYFTEGRRVVEALEAAGGARPEADISRLNLAAPLEDGTRIYVPQIGEDPPDAQAATGALSPGGSEAGGSRSQSGFSSAKININKASASELEKLPGIGPALAERIVADRKRNGPFQKAQDLARVPGIGDVKIAQLVPLITF